MPLTTGSGQQLRRGRRRDGDLQPRRGRECQPADLSHHCHAERQRGALNNYIITNDGAEFTINKRLATWTTNPNSKTYGDLDPVPLTTGTGSNFIAADGVTATYDRGAGENCEPTDLSHHCHAQRHR